MENRLFVSDVDRGRASSATRTIGVGSVRFVSGELVGVIRWFKLAPIGLEKGRL